MLWVWRRHGFLSVIENTSVEGYALSRAIQEWNTAREALARSVADAQRTSGDLDDAAADWASDRVETAQQREHAARERVRTAMVALHEKFPDDPTLTDDLHALFPG